MPKDKGYQKKNGALDKPKPKPKPKSKPKAKEKKAVGGVYV